MDAGIKLKKLRESKRFSQEELAEMVGVSQTTIGNWEKGKSIKFKHLRKVCEVFQIPVNYLFEEADFNFTVVSNDDDKLQTDFKNFIKVFYCFFKDFNKKNGFME